MLKNTRKSQSGFTLVEIMIVVAIIALLAAIAVPGFLRSRKRSQATAILNDARVLDGAKDQYAIENNKTGSTAVDATMLTAYLKPGTRLYTASQTAGVSSIKDLLNNTYNLGTMDGTVKVDTATSKEFSNVIESSLSFWGTYLTSGG